MPISVTEVVGNSIRNRFPFSPELFIPRAAFFNFAYFFTGEPCIVISTGKRVVFFACSF